MDSLEQGWMNVRAPPKGQVAGSNPARGANKIKALQAISNKACALFLFGPIFRPIKIFWHDAATT
jgi:hypothetical protein